MYVEVVVIDHVDASREDALERALEPVVRCLATRSRFGRARSAKVEIEVGHEGLSYRSSLWYRGERPALVRHFGSLEQVPLVDRLADVWRSDAECRPEAPITLPASSPLPARVPDVWRGGELPRLHPASPEEARRALAEVIRDITLGRPLRSGWVVGAPDQAADIVEVIRCSRRYGYGARGVHDVRVTVGANLHVEVALTWTPVIRVFDRPWSGDLAKLPADVAAALSGPFETAIDCSDAWRSGWALPGEGWNGRASP